MTPAKVRATLWFGLAACAAGGFGLLAAAVARGKTSELDERAKRFVHRLRDEDARGEALHRAALSTTPLGKWWAYVPASLATARRLLAAGRRSAGLTIGVGAVATAFAPMVFERLVARRLPPPERHEDSKQSFPSGHALQSSAMALTTSYVLAREGEVRSWAAGPATLASVAAGAGRLLLDRHWLSDVVGGYLAGIAVGASAAGCYELLESR
jgi:undecaprenyl-diphosphatase